MGDLQNSTNKPNFQNNHKHNNKASNGRKDIHSSKKRKPKHQITTLGYKPRGIYELDRAEQLGFSLTLTNDTFNPTEPIYNYHKSNKKYQNKTNFKIEELQVAMIENMIKKQ